MKYKALLLDVDGTTIPNKLDGKPSTKVINSIKKAQKIVHVGLATSRCYPIAKPVIDVLSLKGLSIFLGGAKLFDLTKQEYLYKQALDNESAKEVANILTSHNIPFFTCMKDVDELFDKSTTINECHMIYALEVDPKHVEEIINDLAHITTLSVQRIPDWKEHKISLTITHAQATKQHGIVELAKALKIKPEEIIGVGDGYNDFPLLMACGLKIAMGNAVPELKAIAGHIAPSVEDDGVAWVIEKFILTPTP